jgi:hypothetical protein
LSLLRPQLSITQPWSVAGDGVDAVAVRAVQRFQRLKPP